MVRLSIEIVMLAFILLVICASACALPSSIITQGAEKINLQSSKEPTLPSGRRSDVVGIVGGNETTIDVYPYAVNILAFDVSNSYTWFCCGTIINTKSVLTTVADCQNFVFRIRLRVGSSMALSGGKVHIVKHFIAHPGFSYETMDNNIAIVRSATTIVYTAKIVQPAVIAGADYNLPDNETVWALGWGLREKINYSDQLRHVQIRTINQKICQEDNKKQINITDNMLCAGDLHVEGKGTCAFDDGGPLVHNGVVVGVTTILEKFCGSRKHPGVYTRVSRFADWIEKNK